MVVGELSRPPGGGRQSQRETRALRAPKPKASLASNDQPHRNNWWSRSAFEEQSD